MKTPVVVVAFSLAMAILLTASLLIATGTRGENAAWPLAAEASQTIPPQADAGFTTIYGR
jgi:hypothetical protein